MCCLPMSKTVQQRSGERGSALILVLVCLLALSSLVAVNVEYAFDAADDARSLAAEYQAELRADSLFELARELLNADTDSKVDLQGDMWAYPVSTEEFSVTIDPCNARLNINQVSEDQSVQDAVRRMLEKSEKPLELLDALVDWLDADSTERVFGTEGQLYQVVAPFYKPPNRGMVTVDTVFLVNGWDTIGRSWVDERLSVWLKSNKVNLNFVSEEVFKAFAPELEQQWQEIVDWREQSGFTNITQLREAVPMLQNDTELYTQLIRRFDLNSYAYRVLVEVHDAYVHLVKRYIVRRGDSKNDTLILVRADVISVRRQTGEAAKAALGEG